MRFLISVTLWACVFLLRQNFASAVECNGINIAFRPSYLTALRGCTSILGSLTIHSMDDRLNNTEVNSYQFPRLKEITGYLIIYNVKGLSSVGSLFPNLTVIRGKELALSYSLIVFNNPNMTTIGLSSLVTIQRGYVLIEQCPVLCYHNTIDWEILTEEDEDSILAGKGNVIQAARRECPTNASCRACKNTNCWSSYECQRDNDYFKTLTKGVTCNDSCLGKCVNDTTSGCYVCSRLSWNGKCVDECPNDLLIFRDTMRCITKEKCIENHGLIPFNGECRVKCPISYSNYHPVTKELHKHECFECEVKCVSRCPGLTVRGPSDLEHLRECTVVDGPLYINLGTNMTDIYEKLEETLGNIETINGVLTIFRSFSLTSLAFFRNLNRINVQNVTSQLIGNEEREDPKEGYQRLYGLEIYENDNLQTLFNWKEKQHFEIVGGGMFIHYNSKLCMNEVHNLQNITDYDRRHDSFGYSTNGYDESCHATSIYAFHVTTSHSDVQIYWNITDFGANRRLIGYYIYYIEAPSQNITYFSGLDACSTKKFKSQSKTDLPMISKKNHGEVWQSVFIPFGDLKTVKGYYQMNVTDLKQYTQYAYYVRTQLSLKVRDQLINVTQGQSPVKYFRTMPDRPRPPIVRTKAKTNESITLEWMPSTPEHELIERYFIDVYALIEDTKEYENRDYCLNPKEKIENNNRKIVTKAPEEICCSDQRAYLDFFGRELNQTCGDSDSNCEKTFKFVLFHHHVEDVLMKADAARDPSKRNSSIYHHRREYFESPAHHKKGTTDPIIRKNESDSTRYYLHSHIIDDKYMGSIVVPNLKPFHLYAFHVYACNSVSNCSDYYFHSDRTDPLPSTDDVNITAIPDENRSDFVAFTINPPAEPNSHIVAYQIHGRDNTRNMSGTTCITRKDMESMNYTFRVENLLNGLYIYRIRTISIGGTGLYSSPELVAIEVPDNEMYIVGTVSAFGSIAAIILVFIVYRYIMDRHCGRHDDSELLLNSSSDTDEQYQEGFKMTRLFRRSPMSKYRRRRPKVWFGKSATWEANTSDILDQTIMQQMLEPTVFPFKESPKKPEVANAATDNPSQQGTETKDLLMGDVAVVPESQGREFEVRLMQSLSEDSSIEKPILPRKPETDSEDPLVEQPLLNQSNGNGSDSDYGDDDYALFN